MSLKSKRLVGVLFTALTLSLLAGPTARAENNGIPLRVFSDVAYGYSQWDANNSFRISGLTLFMAQPIDKKTNFLAEVVFQPRFHSVETDLERLYIQYVADPWFKVSVGLLHTAFGYWNDTYHHGRYLYTPVNRPYMERVEFDQGSLPMHTIGLEIRGNGLVNCGNLLYALDIGNGRGPVKDPPALTYSYSKAKSFNLLLAYELENGIRFGGNLYGSTLPGGVQLANDGTPYVDANGNTITGPDGTEWIGALHLVYNSSKIEFINEGALVKRFYGSSNDNSITTMNFFYSQLGYHIGKWTPYFRYEFASTNQRDPYLNANTGNGENPTFEGELTFLTAGVRYELSTWSALKLEGLYLPTVDTWSTTINWSFAW